MQLVLLSVLLAVQPLLHTHQSLPMHAGQLTMKCCLAELDWQVWSHMQLALVEQES